MVLNPRILRSVWQSVLFAERPLLQSVRWSPYPFCESKSLSGEGVSSRNVHFVEVPPETKAISIGASSFLRFLPFDNDFLRKQTSAWSLRGGMRGIGCTGTHIMQVDNAR